MNEQSDYLNSSMIKTFIAISVNQTISVLIAKAEKIIYDCLWYNYILGHKLLKSLYDKSSILITFSILKTDNGDVFNDLVAMAVSL